MELFAGSLGSGIVRILHDPKAQVKNPDERSPEKTSDSLETEGTLDETSKMDTSEVIPVEISQDTDREEERKEDVRAAATGSLVVSEDSSDASPSIMGSASAESCGSLSSQIDLLDFSESGSESDGNVAGSLLPKDDGKPI